MGINLCLFGFISLKSKVILSLLCSHHLLHSADLVDVPIDELLFDIGDDFGRLRSINLAILFPSNFLFRALQGFQVGIRAQSHAFLLLALVPLLQIFKVNHSVIIGCTVLQGPTRHLFRLRDTDSAVFVRTAELARCQMNLPLLHRHSDVGQLKGSFKLIVIRECFHFSLQYLLNIRNEFLFELFKAFLGGLSLATEVSDALSLHTFAILLNNFLVLDVDSGTARVLKLLHSVHLDCLLLDVLNAF